jgi:hypothetical protein
MDFAVYPGTRISRLPRPLRLPALLVRNLLVRPAGSSRPAYAFAGDGIATNHFCPFLEDAEFTALFEEIVEPWLGRRVDLRWRVWILTQAARQSSPLPGNFVEFGVYRGGYAFMVLSRTALRDDQRFYLFDTFAGIPGTRLTERENADGFAKRLSDTSVEHVSKLLARWRSRLVFVEGDVFETIPQTETGPLAFASLDLNASGATGEALRYLYPRLVPGAMLVMDDYGWAGYEDQRAVIDGFFEGKPERVMALPTGQALVVKTRGPVSP